MRFDMKSKSPLCVHLIDSHSSCSDAWRTWEWGSSENGAPSSIRNSPPEALTTRSRWPPTLEKILHSQAFFLSLRDPSHLHINTYRFLVFPYPHEAGNRSFSFSFELLGPTRIIPLRAGVAIDITIGRPLPRDKVCAVLDPEEWMSSSSACCIHRPAKAISIGRGTVIA